MNQQVMGYFLILIIILFVFFILVAGITLGLIDIGAIMSKATEGSASVAANGG